MEKHLHDRMCSVRMSTRCAGKLPVDVEASVLTNVVNGYVLRRRRYPHERVLCLFLMGGYMEHFFTDHPEVAIAFSGGVDSAYLLYAASKYAKRVKAYYVYTPFQPRFELEDATRLAKELNVQIEVLSIDILQDPSISSNPTDRCYHCKKTLFSCILNAAKKDGFTILLDGTNANDEASDRPGMRALTELSVRSPLRECGLSKPMVRHLSKEAGLFTHDKPAYACLATRIPTGEAITNDKLLRTEQAEIYLSGLGFRDFRVRSQEDTAKIQVTAQDLPLVMAYRDDILKELQKNYTAVLLDLEVRK